MKRSIVFWMSDISNCVDHVRVAADEYEKVDRAQFLHDVAQELLLAAKEEEAERDAL